MPPTFPFLPPRIAGLAELACNLSWTWNRDARGLFRALDENLWVRFRFDPLAMLGAMRAESLAARATDPHFLKLYDQMVQTQDMTQRNKLLKDIAIKVMVDAAVIPAPTPNRHFFWAPWLKGYWGQNGVSWGSRGLHKHFWVDQDLKEQMTGRR